MKSSVIIRQDFSEETIKLAIQKRLAENDPGWLVKIDRLAWVHLENEKPSQLIFRGTMAQTNVLVMGVAYLRCRLIRKREDMGKYTIENYLEIELEKVAL